jgi:hypothetical protein
VQNFVTKWEKPAKGTYDSIKAVINQYFTKIAEAQKFQIRSPQYITWYVGTT